MTSHPNRNWRNRAAGLAQWRDARGLTQDAAAKMVGVARRTWQDWEGQKAKPPEMLWLLLERL